MKLASCLALILSALALVLALSRQPALAPEPEKETAYERVLRTGTLRCGYLQSRPSLNIDPGTGRISGVIYDVMEEAGRLLNLKIQWAEELGWASTAEAIDSGRVDAICTNFWMNPAEGKYLGFSIPLYFTAVGAFARADDTRFDGDVTKINDPSVKISIIDGGMPQIIAREDFPHAQTLSLPNLTDVTQQTMNVTTGKADVTFLALYEAEEFLKSNPGSIKNIDPRQPVRLFANTIALPIGDAKLKSMLDTALSQLLWSGFAQRALDAHAPTPGFYLPVAVPYSPETNHDRS